LKVACFEKNDVAGGAAVTEEFAPGFRNSVASYTVSLLNPKVIADLELTTRHGLEIIERPLSNFWPVGEHRYLAFPNAPGDPQAKQREIAKFSERDARALPAFEEMLDRAAEILRDMVLRTPPNAGSGLKSLIAGTPLGLKLAGLSLADKKLITDLFTRSAADVLDDWFEDDTVKAAFAFDGIVGAYAAPSTPGTAYVLLHHCFGEVNGRSGVWGHAIGGMGAISEAIRASAELAGAEIHLGDGVSEVLADDGKAAGVRLASGRVVTARAVAANVGPKLLFRRLLPDGVVPPEMAKPFRNMKTGSGTFRMNLALSELPDFVACPGTNQQPHHGAGIIIGPTMDYLEQAYFDARTQGWSREPVIEMLIPSTIDPSLAPPGQHVASLFVQHVAPHLPDGRSWADVSEKESFADLVIATLGKHAPNLPDAVIARQVLSPKDLETRFGLIDGDIFHGQLSLNQLFSLRPVIGSADYRLPLKGLYLCGSGAHPGGGVSGVPGHNAAREILKDFGRNEGWFAKLRSN
ncbi:MAG: NAD(P)/FAD-dependent oxidoreductase, partial [Pseudomonadota bacterium]